MIKKISVVLILVLMLFLTACENKKYKVGVIIYEENDTFMKEFVSELLKFNNEDISFEILYSLSSQSKQNQQLIDLLNQGVDLLVINPVDRLAAKTIIEKTDESNTPIIFINRQPQKQDLEERENLYYVGANPKSQGQLQAEAASIFLGNANQINAKYDRNNDNIIQTVILKGEPGHQDAEDRTNESIRHLKELGYEVQVLQSKVANWQKSEAKIAIRELDLKFGEEIELILSNNDDMALGVIEYYLENQRIEDIDNILLIGVDKTKPAIDTIASGHLNATVLNDFVNQANAVNQLIRILINGHNLSDLEYDLIDDRYILLDGEIYLGE